MTEAWNIGPGPSGRSTIRDENGLFVAECITEDAPIIAQGPAMCAALREVLTEIRRLNRAAGHTVFNPTVTVMINICLAGIKEEA